MNVKPRASKKLRPKAGTSKEAAAEKHKIFAMTYLTNGRNGKQAAIIAGYAPRSAEVRASELLKDPKIREMIAKATEKASAASDLNAENVLREIRRIAFSDTRKLYREDGSLLMPHEWDDDTAAAVAGVETMEEFSGRSAERKLVGFTKKTKLWNKVEALDKAAKHLGLYERDNAQRAPNLALQVLVVGPE